jgi:two-component system CheB/CheR fusion protein
VGSQIALSLALVAHEMTTNASKYGALSRSGGRIDISWAIQEGSLHLRWHEQGGPAVTQPEATGFGFELLHGEIEYRLQGKLDISYEPGGLQAHIVLPYKEKEDAR